MALSCAAGLALYENEPAYAQLGPIYGGGLNVDGGGRRIELSIIIIVLMGWQFALAEFVGAPIRQMPTATGPAKPRPDRP